jgi:hypothetical protein
VVILPGRPHQIGITSTLPKVRFQLTEVVTGALRANIMLGPRDEEVLINVKGATMLNATAIEALQVRIDGRRFQFPALASGLMTVELPDAESSPPPPPVVPPNSPAAAQVKKKR